MRIEDHNQLTKKVPTKLDIIDRMKSLYPYDVEGRGFNNRELLGEIVLESDGNRITNGRKFEVWGFNNRLEDPKSYRSYVYILLSDMKPWDRNDFVQLAFLQEYENHYPIITQKLTLYAYLLKKFKSEGLDYFNTLGEDGESILTPSPFQQQSGVITQVFQSDSEAVPTFVELCTNQYENREIDNLSFDIARAIFNTWVLGEFDKKP